MAIVTLGGLVTTTLLTLFVLPALYLRFGGRQRTLSPEEVLIRQWAGIEPETTDTASAPAEAPSDPVGSGSTEPNGAPASVQTTDGRGESDAPERMA